jgi:hypothetical protein
MIAETNRVTPAPMASPGKIYGAIIAAKRKIGAIGKNGSVTEYGKYDYRKFDDVIDAVAPLLDEYGILVVPTVIAKEERQDQKKHFVTLTMSYRMFAEDGSSIEGSATGEAFDVGDKAATKAQTVALRIFYCTVLNIAYHEMQDAEDGPQHAWTERSNGTLNRMIGTLTFLQEPEKLNTILTYAIKSVDNVMENGDILTKAELQKAVEAFTSAANRLGLSETVVKQIKARLATAIAGDGKASSATAAPPIVVEPHKFRELLLDFGTANDTKTFEKAVMTLLQSYKSGHIEREDISEIVAKYCPEDDSNGHACFHLGAIHGSGAVNEIVQMRQSMWEANVDGKVGVDVANSLSIYAEHLIKTLGARHGDA